MKKILKLILKKLILSLILIFSFLVCISYADINIKYLGHSCFYILNKENNNNLSILIDPYSYEIHTKNEKIKIKDIINFFKIGLKIFFIISSFIEVYF